MNKDHTLDLRLKGIFFLFSTHIAAKLSKDLPFFIVITSTIDFINN